MTSSNLRARLWIFPDSQTGCQQALGPGPKPFFLHCQKPHHQSLTNSWVVGYSMNPWNPVGLYLHSVCSCGWDDSLMYATGTLGGGLMPKAGAISKKHRIWSLKARLESQSSTYWLIGPGGWILWFQHNHPVSPRKPFNFSKPRFFRRKWREFLLFPSHKIAVMFK